MPKDHVRGAFVAAAAETFAELGFAATSMAAIAERAGSSVGNLYKYFASKQQLFDAAVPPELAQELRRRTRARIRALGAARDVAALPEGARYHALAGSLLDYCFEHRAAVVVLLARAEETPYATFSAQFVDELVQWALDYAGRAYPGLQVTAELRFVLRRAYRGFLGGVADALREFPNEARARAVIGLLTTHHQAGLQRLFETVGGRDAPPCPAESSSVVQHSARPRAVDAAARGPSPSSARRVAGKTDRANRAGRRG